MAAEVTLLEVLEASAQFVDDGALGGGPFVKLVRRGVSRKQALLTILEMVDSGLLTYGVSPYQPWPTERGRIALDLLRGNDDAG